MEVKVEDARESSPKTKTPTANTTSWRYLLRPHQWTGYDKPEYIWQPVSEIEKYNIVPLLIGSLKATLVALVLFSAAGAGRGHLCVATFHAADAGMAQAGH